MNPIHYNHMYTNYVMVIHTKVLIPLQFTGSDPSAAKMSSDYKLI